MLSGLLELHGLANEETTKYSVRFTCSFQPSERFS